MAADLVGTYEFDNDDGNFDNLLKALGIGFMSRKMACSAKPSIEISIKEDGTVSCETTTVFKTSKIEFKIGEEFEQKRMDDKIVKTTITRDGNKLVEKQNCDNPVEIVREFGGEWDLVTTAKCKDVVCVRKYKKLQK